MARMKDVLIDIEELTVEGLTPVEISTRLGIPVYWVTDALSYIDAETQLELAPYVKEQ